MRTLLTPLALLMLAGPAAAAPFTMTCTSGGSMEATFSRSQGRRARSGKTSVTFRYKKAKQGANARAPGRGECAWAHRKLNNKEGTSARLTVGKAGFTTVKATAKGLQVNFSDKNVDRLLKHVAKPGKRFSLVVANKGGRLLIQKVH